MKGEFPSASISPNIASCYYFFLDTMSMNWYINFRRSVIEVTSGEKEKFNPLMLESLDYLDLQLDQMEDCHSFERPFSRRGWIKYFRYQLLDQLGLDWDQRIEKRKANLVRNALGIRWRNFMNFCLESMTLSIYDIILLQIDHLTAIMRRYIKPLWYIRQFRMKIRVNNSDLDIDFFILFFRLLFTYSSDSQLLVDFLRILFFESKCREFMLAVVPVHGLDYILRHSQKARFSLWGAFPAFADQENGKHLIPRYIVEDTVEAISTLVKYGAAVEKAVMQRPIQILHLTMSWYFPDLDVLNPLSLKWNLRSRRDKLMNQIVHYAMMYYVKSISLEHAQKCIKLIWRSLPDVYPTTKQLENHIVTMCVQTRPLTTANRTAESMIKGMCDFYKDTVSGSASEGPQPRSLKQYCRCSIRKQLLKSSYLPEGISNLGFAPSLERYLRLDC